MPTAKTDIDVDAQTTGPRSRKGRETRARLLAAAKQVFEDSGFLNARISDIVAGAGISHGAFYHYFDSKEQIFREVATEQEVSMLTLGDKIERRTSKAPTGVSPFDRIRDANAAYFEAYRSEAKIMKVIEEVSRYDDQVYAVRAQRQREFGALVSRSISQLQEKGLADPRIDPDVAATALGGMIAKYAEMILVQHYADFGMMHSIDQLTLLWANAIGLDSGRTA